MASTAPSQPVSGDDGALLPDAGPYRGWRGGSGQHPSRMQEPFFGTAALKMPLAWGLEVAHLCPFMKWANDNKFIRTSCD